MGLEYFQSVWIWKFDTSLIQNKIKMHESFSRRNIEDSVVDELLYTIHGLITSFKKKHTPFVILTATHRQLAVSEC